MDRLIDRHMDGYMDGHMGKPKIGFVNYMLFYGYFLTYANRKSCRPIRGEGAMD